MQMFAVLALLSAVAANAALARGDEHPIVKVIDLLDGLITKVQSEGQEEEILFTKFVYWCDNGEKTLKAAITKEKADIEKFESIVSGKELENETLTTEIEHLTVEITNKTAAGVKADANRDDAKALWEQADKDYATTLTAIDECITALDDSKPAALLQKSLKKLSALPLVLAELSDAQTAMLFHSTAPASSAPERPDMLSEGDYDEAKANSKYQWKSGSVVDLLKQLKITIQDEKTEAATAETNSINAHALAKQQRDEAIKQAEASKTKKEGIKSDVLTDLADAKSDLKNSEDDLAADEATLLSTTASCDTKKEEWDERSKVRENERKALVAGKKILAKVAGVRTDAPSNPTLPPSPAELQERATLFLQSDDPRSKVVNLIREEARRAHSHAFSVFANKLAANARGPFDKVNNMIQKMIFQLMAEQKDEDDHKNWCDIELDKTNATITKKEEKIDTLSLKIKDSTAAVALLMNEIETADEMVATLEAHMGEATEIRNEGRRENEEAIRDAKQAQTAIAQAIAVILEFYKNSGEVPKESWEFLQKAPVTLPAEPSTWSASYTGVSDPTKQPEGVVAVLKTISADFASMQADSEAQEEMDQKAYDEEITTSKTEKKRREKESELKNVEKQRHLEKLESMKKSKKHTEDELGTVNKYYKELVPACVDGDSTYEDRKAARDKEIEALKEAQQILRDAENAPPAKSAAAFLAPIKKSF